MEPPWQRLKNFASLGTGQVFTFICGIIAGIYARRVLGVTAIGQVAWCVSVLSYFTLLVNPGLDTIAQRDVARDHSKGSEYVSKMFSIKLLLAVSSFILIVIFALLKLRGAHISTLLVLQGIGLLLLPLNLNWLLLGLERMGTQALVISAAQLLQLAALFLLVRESSDLIRYILYPYPFVIGTALVVAWFIRKHGKLDVNRLKFSLQGTGRMLRESYPLGLSQVATLLYFNSDAIFLGFLHGDTTVGLYSTAYRLWSYAVFPFSTLTQAYFPSFARTVDDAPAQRQFSSEFFRLLTWFGLPVAAMCWALGRHIVDLLYGVKFQESGPLFEWLSLNIALSSFTWGITTPLVAWGHQKKMFYITLMAALTNVALNFAVIPRYGAPGAVATTLFAEFIALICGVAIRRKICPLPWLKLSWKPLATAAVIAALLRWLVVVAPSYWWLGLLGGSGLIAICLWFAERATIIGLVNRWKSR